VERYCNCGIDDCGLFRSDKLYTELAFESGIDLTSQSLRKQKIRFSSLQAMGRFCRTGGASVPYPDDRPKYFLQCKNPARGGTYLLLTAQVLFDKINALTLLAICSILKTKFNNPRINLQLLYFQ
jgi:hypothetical protein